MNRATQAWAAFKNMMRAASRDPFWALVALISVPFRFAKAFAMAAVFFMIVLLVVVVAREYLLGLVGSVKGDALWYLTDAMVTLFILHFVFRAITEPLIVHFGDMSDDTHGSDRFATNKEVAPLMKAQSGLLIGRDGKTGKLMRYDGPAHLLTMAPTRTGKGVGTIIPNLGSEQEQSEIVR